MSEHAITLIVLIVCSTWLAIALLRYFGLIGLFVLMIILVAAWPTIHKLVERI